MLFNKSRHLLHIRSKKKKVQLLSAKRLQTFRKTVNLHICQFIDLCKHNLDMIQNYKAAFTIKAYYVHYILKQFLKKSEGRTKHYSLSLIGFSVMVKKQKQIERKKPIKTADFKHRWPHS